MGLNYRFVGFFAMSLPNAASKALAAVNVETFSAGLQPRTLGGLVDFGAPSWRLIYVEDGAVEVVHEDDSQTLRGPTLIWSPWSSSKRLRAEAGSSGAVILLDELTLTNAIGHKPESADLRMLVTSAFSLGLSSDKDINTDVRRVFTKMHQEFAEGLPGAATIIEAEIRILLVLMWRQTARPTIGLGKSAGSAQALSAFRHLVEMHFRDRWQIADYAAELGMTRDRLHDICKRAVGKPPLRLVHERSAAEAEILLVRSTQTIDQIAGHLGFSSTPHFSRFVRGMLGAPPGAIRKNAEDDGGQTMRDSSRSFADWP